MAEIIEISDSESSAGSVLDLTSDSTADSVLDLTTDDDARAAGDDARRATPYAFSPQRAATPTPSVAEMKATIRRAGLGTEDLCERSDVVARYAQAKARLAEAARLKRSFDGAGGGAAPKRPKVSARVPPRAARPTGPPFGVRITPSTAMRVERNVADIQGLHIVYDAFPERVEQLMFEEMKGFQTVELQKRSSGAPYPRVADMKNASMKTGPDGKPYAAGGIAALVKRLTNGAAGGREEAARELGNIYGRAQKSPITNFNSFSPYDWPVISTVRDQLCPGLVVPDENKGMQYIHGGKKEAISNHYDPLSYGEYIVGVSLGRGLTLKMQRCPKGHSRCDCKGAARALIEVVRIPLPRRSIYILEGQARYSPGYTHGLEWPANREPSPSWNPTGERRSRTYRATKAWNLFCLEPESVLSPGDLKRYADVLPKLCPAGPAERRARADALRPLEPRGRGKRAKPKRAAAPETNLKRLAKLSEKLAWRF